MNNLAIQEYFELALVFIQCVYHSHSTTTTTTTTTRTRTTKRKMTMNKTLNEPLP